MLLKLEDSLTQQDLYRLGFYYNKDYEESESINGLKFFRDLIREGAIYCNNVSLINELIEGLRNIKRSDLIPMVEDYKTHCGMKVMPVPKPFARPQVKPTGGKEQEETISSSEDGSNSMDECQKGMESVMISGFKKSGSGVEGYYTYAPSPNGMKRRRTGIFYIICTHIQAPNQSSEKHIPV